MEVLGPLITQDCMGTLQGQLCAITQCCVRGLAPGSPSSLPLPLVSQRRGPLGQAGDTNSRRVPVTNLYLVLSPPPIPGSRVCPSVSRCTSLTRSPSISWLSGQGQPRLPARALGSSWPGIEAVLPAASAEPRRNWAPASHLLPEPERGHASAIHPLLWAPYSPLPTPCLAPPSLLGPQSKPGP